MIQKKAKISKIILYIILTMTVLVSSITPVLNAGAVDNCLVTLLCVPGEGVQYDFYSIVNVKIINEETGQTFSKDLYSYNNFSDKILLPYGIYSVIDASIVNRNDAVYEVECQDKYIVHSSSSIVFTLKDSKVMKTTEPTTFVISLNPDNEDEKTTESDSTSLTESVTESTTQKELSTLFPMISDDYSETTEENGNNTSVSISASEALTTSDSSELSGTAGKTFVIVLAAAAVLCLICIIVVIISKNKK